MTQSAEYPDLKWLPPAAFGTGRDGKAVRYIVIHYTAGAERNTSAEDGAAYDQRRTDGVSCHYFVDSDSVVQCVLTKNRGNAARHRGNRLGIQYELCGTVQTRAQWLDTASLATLKNAARQVARDCRKYGIPVRRLPVAETRAAWYDFPAGPKGIVGHVDCTRAYPEDGGDHTDPGAQFPWDVFLDLVRDEMEDDMTKDEMLALLRSDEGKAAVGAGAWSYLIASPALDVDPKPASDWAKDAEQVSRELAAGITKLTAAIQAAGVADDDELAAIQQQLATLPAATADAVPAALGAVASPEEKAELLRVALGDDAPAVGRLLAG